MKLFLQTKRRILGQVQVQNIIRSALMTSEFSFLQPYFRRLVSDYCISSLTLYQFVTDIFLLGLPGEIEQVIMINCLAEFILYLLGIKY